MSDTRARWGLILLSMTFSFCVVACDAPADEADEDSESSEVAAEETPESLARENNESAVEELAASDKGVDEEGEKLWKQEARDFFDFKKNPNNRTFELSSTFARQFTEDVYKAGAPTVWVTSIGEIELGDQKYNVSDNLVVVLPDDAEKRKAVFAVYNKLIGEAGDAAMSDIGQKYIFITGD